MPEGQARMAQETERQRGMVTHARAPAAERRAERVERVRAYVRELVPLEVAPDEFDGIQLRRVAGQPFDGEPRALPGQVRAHGAAAVSREPVPDQGDGLAAKVPLQVAQEADEGVVTVG